MEWIREYVDFFNEKLSSVVPRHPKEVFGPVEEYVYRGGKRIRPVIAMVSCESFGGEREYVLEDAYIIELFHNFSLIHDDIEDGSKLRRGKPTLHELYGVPWALNVGDALYTYVWGLVLKRPSFVREKHYEVFSKVVEGQGYELYYEAFNVWDLKEEDYFKIVKNKTAALIAHAAALGAYDAVGREDVYMPIYNVFLNAGIAFQIRDDILNLKGDEKKYGKEKGGDITEGKRTLMLINAYRTLPKEKAERLRKIVEMKTEDRELIEEAISLMDEAGAITYAEEKAREYAEKALEGLKDVYFPNSEKGNLLKEIVYYLIGREK